MTEHPKEVAPQAEQMGCLAVVVRLTWLMVGNAALFFLAIRIAQRKAFSGFDIAFWGTVAGLVLLRYVDITRLRGFTKDGEPASLRHWRNYTLLLLLISAGLWILAHVVAKRA